MNDSDHSAPTHTTRITTTAFIVGALVVSVVLAFFVSSYASGSPDGLERVAEDKGIDSEVTDHALGSWPFADYSTRGVDNELLSTGITGLLGIAICFAVGYGLVWVVRRPGSKDRDGEPSLS